MSKKEYKKREEHFTQNTSKIILIQSYVRMWIRRKQYLQKINHYKNNVRIFVKIIFFF